MGLMVTTLCLTNCGRSTIDYIISCCFPRWQPYVANRIAERDSLRARELMRSHALRRRAALERRNQRAGTPMLFQYDDDDMDDMMSEEDDTTTADEEEIRRPNRLKLKTCIYHAEDDVTKKKSVVNNDYSGEVSCVICFSQIDDGDRVGALKCQHVFHAECLKSWLARKNICPLCQRAGVAESMYDSEEGGIDQTNGARASAGQTQDDA